jgi:hypothetical protein
MEVKNNHANVATQNILKKFKIIEKNFYVVWLQCCLFQQRHQ